MKLKRKTPTFFFLFAFVFFFFSFVFSIKGESQSGRDDQLKIPMCVLFFRKKSGVRGGARCCCRSGCLGCRRCFLRRLSLPPPRLPPLCCPKAWRSRRGGPAPLSRPEEWREGTRKKGRFRSRRRRRRQSRCLSEAKRLLDLLRRLRRRQNRRASCGEKPQETLLRLPRRHPHRLRLHHRASSPSSSSGNASEGQGSAPGRGGEEGQREPLPLPLLLRRRRGSFGERGGCRLAAKLQQRQQQQGPLRPLRPPR